jgi:hypothetical protein
MYLAGPLEASAAFTVFFDTPSSRATALIGIPLAVQPPDLCQSSTLSTLFLP